MLSVKELDKLNRDLDAIAKSLFEKTKEIPDVVTKEIAIGANDIRSTIILSMRETPKTGRPYKRGNKIHIASSPGNAPAIDKGQLIRSIIFDVRDMEVEVGSAGGAPYADFLEQGTSKMEPRPFLGPAVDKHAREIVQRVGKSVIQLISEPFEGK